MLSDKRWNLLIEEGIFHFLGWLVFLSLPFALYPDFFFVLKNNKNILIFHLIIFNLFLVAFFYLHYFFLLPYYFFQKKYGRYLIFIFFSIYLCVLIVNAAAPTHFAPPAIIPGAGGVPPPSAKFGFFGRFFIVLLFSAGLRTYKNWNEAKNQKKEMELYYLKAQIDQHFFFNTLNNIYALSLNKSEKTSEYIAKFASMMRYVITDATQLSLPLQQEISYLKNYTELQKLRLQPHTEIIFEHSILNEKSKIAPLLLITFIENAFKYGISNELPTQIRINITNIGNELKFIVENDKPMQSSPQSSTKIGLKNTKRRLENLYPGKHQLTIEDNDTNFKVYLKLKLL